MLSALLGDGKDLIPLKRLIIERTEGTPFFMEEIVQALFEDGVLQRNGVVRLARSMNVVKVPATVQAVLAGRIDRLPPDEKELLQTLAVIGREFALSLVTAWLPGGRMMSWSVCSPPCKLRSSSTSNQPPSMSSTSSNTR